jgi:hypothetical protein
MCFWANSEISVNHQSQKTKLLCENIFENHYSIFLEKLLSINLYFGKC